MAYKKISYIENFTDSGLNEFALNISKVTSLNKMHLVFQYLLKLTKEQDSSK